MTSFIPYALPDIGEEEIAEVVDTLRSGWVTTGPKTKLFEEAFANVIDPSSEAIAVNSATAGLHLALEALGITHGDEVITSTLTFTATAEVIRYLGADVKFADIDPETLNINPAAIKNLITKKTKAIIPVHYAGLSCDMTSIFEIAQEYNLKIIEDAAHALPTTYQNKLIGSLNSDVTVFSFYANKTMTTGEGGMIITKNPLLASRMRVMRLHGINRDAFDRFRSNKPSWYYEVVAPGYKYNLTDIASALGIQQLKKLLQFQKRRQYLAERYFSGLSELPLTLPPKPHDQDMHSWHLYVLRIKKSANLNRDELIAYLSNQGIGTSVHYVPLHRQPYWRDRYKLTQNMFPEADKAYLAMLSIPLYTAMSDLQQDKVISSIREAFNVD
jgi:dTDP-4-amino-4,6-dideoxygalactose transaminase